jgi:hypothetical protein
MKSKFVVAAATAVMLSGFAGEAFAAKNASNGKPTAEQRKQLYQAGLKSCRKRFGAQLHEVRVEKFYGKWAAVCYHY